MGIPKEFPGLGALSTNPFHHYIGSLAEALHIEAAELPFSAVPLLTSLVVALGGLFLGWLVYRGAGKLRAGQHVASPAEYVDPLAKPLGRLYTVLRNKYYFDELYHKVFVKGAQRLANWLYRFDDLWVIDPIVDGVGKLGRRLSEIGEWFDTHIVDAAVNGVGAVTGWFGSAVRVIQTGKAQNYLLVGLVTVSVLVGRILVVAEIVSSIRISRRFLFMTNSLLTIITFVPLVGALLTLLPWGKWLRLDKAGEERLIKNGAIAISLLPLGLAIVLWFGYNQAPAAYSSTSRRRGSP